MQMDWYTLFLSLVAYSNSETFAFHSFFQKNIIYNNKDTLLDLIFSDGTSLIVEKADEPIVTIDFFTQPYVSLFFLARLCLGTN